MKRSYRATLHGDRVEWLDRPPDHGEATPIRVTFAEGGGDQLADRGDAMADALERIAERGGLPGTEDPAQWQRQQRRDRRLPGRGG